MDRTWKADKVINGWDDKPIRVQKPDDPFEDDENSEFKMGDLTVFDAVLLVSNRFSCKTIEDSEKKRAIKKALKESQKSGKLVLDAAPHNWLKEAAKVVCPPAWQDNGDLVYEVISEGYARENPGKREPEGDE